MEMPNGMATLHSIIFFLPYVQAAEELFTTFKSIPKGIASVLKSIPSQNRIGIYSCDPPNPIIANTNAMRKKMGGERYTISIFVTALRYDVCQLAFGATSGGEF